MVNNPSNGPAEVSLATTVVAVGVGEVVKFLVAAEPVLAAISYIVAIAAGVITIYFKVKNHKD